MTTESIRYEFQITDEHDQTVASGEAPTQEEAKREGRHYLSQYQQDGPCTLEVRRVEVLEVSGPGPAPAAELPLWRTMQKAYANAPDAPDGWTDRHGYAAEILAVRDRLFPGGRPDLAICAPDCLTVWLALSTEAERADRGE